MHDMVNYKHLFHGLFLLVGMLRLHFIDKQMSILEKTVHK